MASYIDEQAEVSDNEDSNSEILEPLPKKRKTKRHIASSDEEDEMDDDAAALKEMEGFVVNEDEVDEVESEDDKSDKSGSDGDDLQDDDLDLINENIGRNVGRRVEISDDEDEREKIKNDLFGGGAYDDEEFVDNRRTQRSRSASVSSRESYEDDDRFIVHDNGLPSRRRHDRPIKNRAELLEAQDIFGFENEDVLGGMDEIFADLDEEEGAYETGRHDHTLIGVIEPDELEKHDSEERKIVFEDVPERFQTRKIPVTPAEEDELKDEARWIQQNAFESSSLISRQEGIGFSILEQSNMHRFPEDRDVQGCIQEVLNFIRNSNLEVPFIAFYRKEHVDGILGIQDLWNIYEHDEKWTHFRDKKKRLIDLLNRMSNFIKDLSQNDEMVRPITDKDYQDLQTAQTNEEIMDCFEHFQLYYSNFLTRMVQHEIEQNENPDQHQSTVPKITPRNDKYWNCALNGPGALTSMFGLTSEQVAENFDYIRHHCASSEQSPEEIAESCKTLLFSEVDMILDGAVYVMAYRLSREPGVRRKVREVFRKHAKIRVYPTKRGLVTIDEAHPLYSKRYTDGKPVRELEKTEYLQYQVAKESNLLHVEIFVDNPIDDTVPLNNTSVINDILREDYFRTDENTEVSMRWNELRQKSLADCVNILCRTLQKETHELLLNEAKNCVLREARSYFEMRISPGRYRPTIAYTIDDEDMEDIDANNPHVRLIAVAPASEFSGETVAVALDQNGLVVETCPITFQSRFNNAQLKPDSKDNINVSLRAFIQMCASHKPHAIVIAASDMKSIHLKQGIERTIKDAFNREKLTQEIPVEFVTAEAAKIYAKSKMSEQEFPSYSSTTRMAISAGRTIFDPLVEYAHLCNSEKDFLGIRVHKLQNYVPAQELAWCFYREFINRVSEVGVDINHCIEFPHTDGVLQFVCGLGPRKATHIIQMLKHQNTILDARSKLVTLCNLGSNIFVNAAGFIRIDLEKVQNTSDDYVEQLDGSRVHPETYEWARKMAIDALEFEENNDPSSAIDEIIAQPERLKDLDLDAFAEELSRQGFGNKSITLYDIRAELNNQYKDLRYPYQSLTGHELFKELVNNYELYTQGKIIHGRVGRVIYKREPFVEGNKYRKPKPSENGENFICPDCKSEFRDFYYVTEVHMGKPECRGKPTGVSIQLEDGVSGYIPRKNLSDNNDNEEIDNLCEHLKPGQSLVCRVISFDPARYSCNLSCKSSDLQQIENNKHDEYFNQDREAKDQQSLINATEKNTVKTNFTKRVISHQSFHNVTHADAERMLSTMGQGEAVIRPSSSSINHLAVTWKVTDGIYQHVRIEESKKKHAFDLGKELRINNEVFEDLDEILARYITPLAENAREVLNHKYFVKDFHSEDLPQIQACIRDQKEKQPGRIPYIFTASKNYPGKFLISYQVGGPRHEYFTPTTDGIRFRKNEFTSLESMLAWFKLHYRDPVPR